MRDYQAKCRLARENVEKHWEDKFKNFTWFKKYSKVMDNSDSNFPKWFPGGELSVIYDCLDKHVKNGHGNEIAFFFESFYTKLSSKITYKQLLDKVSRMAGSLAAKGVSKQDKVLIFLPVALETVVSMLATARLGAVYTVTYGGFSHQAIAERIDDYKPKIIVTANDDFALGHSVPMKELMDKAIEIATHKPKCCFIWQRPQFKPSAIVSGRDFDLHEAFEKGEPHDFVPVEVNQPFYVVYTSGTTGKPKGTVHSVRGVAAAIVQDEGFLVNPDIEPLTTSPPVTFITSNFAWIAGQFGACYEPLLCKVSSIIFEGAIKDVEPEDVYQILQKYKVTSAFISTQGLRGMMANDPDGKRAEPFKPFNLKMMLCGGVAGDLPTLTWAQRVFDSPILQLYGQTEIGGLTATIDYNGGDFKYAILSNGKLMPGFNVKIMREDGTEAETGEAGRIMIKAPFPPTLMTTILNNDELFVKDMLSSYKGYYDMKDDGKIDENGYLYVINRSDSVFKVGGHRISCTGIEEVMMSHDAIAECVVVTKLLTKKGVVHQIPEGFFVTKKGVEKSDEVIAEELVQLVHNQIGSFIPLSPPRRVTEIPKTVTGKISRSIVEQILRNPEKRSEYMSSDPTTKSICESIKDIQ